MHAFSGPQHILHSFPLCNDGPLILCVVVEHPNGSSHLVLFSSASIEESSRYLIPWALHMMHRLQVELQLASKGRVTSYHI